MTFEDVVERVADGPAPTMWVMKPDDGTSGCIEDPESEWEVGFMNYDLPGTGPVFRQLAGPQLVN